MKIEINQSNTEAEQTEKGCLRVTAFFVIVTTVVVVVLLLLKKWLM
jgi:hypothetical protein